MLNSKMLRCGTSGARDWSKPAWSPREELATAAVQVERARTNLEVAQARVAEQLARVKQTKELLANTVITATFEGTVAARYLDPGALVHPGSPVINLMRSEDLWVRFAAPENRRVSHVRWRQRRCASRRGSLG